MEILELSLSWNRETIKFSTFTSLLNEKVKFYKGGCYHIIIVTSQNDIFVYGKNTDGQIGLNEEIKVEDFTKVDLKIGNIKNVECGYCYTMIVNDLNEIYFTGTLNNFKSKQFIKLDCPHLKIKSIRCGRNHLFILTNNNIIYGLGSNDQGQLGLCKEIKSCDKLNNITNLKVKEVKCGFDHSVLLDFNRDLYVTGKGWALGLNITGEQENVFEFTKVSLPFAVIKVFASLDCTFIISDNNELYGTGNNQIGQLGLGDNCNFRYTFNKIKLKCDKDTEMIESYNFLTYFNCNNTICYSGLQKKVFTRLYFKLFENKFVYILPLKSKRYVAISDYKINEVAEEINILGLQLLLKLRNNQLADVNLICRFSNLTKRKRVDYEEF